MPERAGLAPTIADALSEAAQRLAAPGIPDPRREARALWAALADSDPGAVWLRRERRAPPDLLHCFRAAVDRRAGGVPFAYAGGWTAFRTLRLKIDQRALIPRPETEGLLDLVLHVLRTTDNGQRQTWGIAADIGTGCGCLALSLAVEGHFERVIAVERSAEAAALARENVASVRPPVPVEVRIGEWLAPLAGSRCRVIVSNPPYLTEAEYADLDPAVRLFEPRDALVSGADGLAATEALFAGARPLLEPGGLLALEIDERRADAARALARSHGWTAVAVHNDLFGRPRYVVARLEEGA
ncbi:MAG TPA: peptide chain release factor N(5)-glutamine methyltransferase [Gemmatimonadales bacterium]|nr:peptide chain release factor N(5)-glutamine methyltransferase [Gemmatimonadales bacterium]